jgi:PUL domain
MALSGSGSLTNVISVLGKLAQWPAAQLLPVLDIFRLLVLQPASARLLAADAGALEPSNPGLGGILARGLSKDAPAPGHLVALRLACNCWKHAALRSWLLGRQGPLLDALADLCPTRQKASRSALATAVLNLAVALVRGDMPEQEDARIRILSMVSEVRALLCACTACQGVQVHSFQRIAAPYENCNDFDHTTHSMKVCWQAASRLESTQHRHKQSCRS